MWINQNSYTKFVKIKNGTNMLEKNLVLSSILENAHTFNLVTLILDR